MPNVKNRKIDVSNREIIYTNNVFFNKSIRMVFNIVLGLTILLTIMYAYWQYFLRFNGSEYFLMKVLPSTVIYVFIEVAILLIFNTIVSISIKEKDKQIIRFTRNADIMATEKKENIEASNYNRLVKINLDNLSEFYETAKSHASRSFYMTISSSIFALLIIMFSFIIGVFDAKYKDISYLTTGAGVFIELISGLLFIIYNKTIQKMKEYHESLVSVQNVLLSFKIIDEVSDQNEKITLFKSLIEVMNKKNG